MVFIVLTTLTQTLQFVGSRNHCLNHVNYRSYNSYPNLALFVKHVSLQISLKYLRNIAEGSATDKGHRVALAWHRPADVLSRLPRLPVRRLHAG